MKMKKMLCSLLALLLIIAMFPGQAMAASNNVTVTKSPTGETV